MKMNEKPKKTDCCDEKLRQSGGYTFGYTSESVKCNPKNFGERLKEIRISSGISQKKLADKINVTSNTIQNYEEGRLPKGNQSIALANVLNCSIDWLLTGKEHQPEQTAAEENQPEPKQPEPPESISQLITKTIEILESETIYSTALSANITAFHEATRTEKKIQEMQESMEARFQKMEQQMETQNREMEELKQENEKLKSQIKDMPGDTGGLAKNAG